MDDEPKERVDIPEWIRVPIRRLPTATKIRVVEVWPNNAWTIRPVIREDNGHDLPQDQH